MSDYITEQEQLEQIKEWFKENGLTLVISILVALFIAYGWQHWQYLRERSLDHASVRYEQLLTSVARNDAAAIQQQANYLISRYPNSSYAKLAGLLLARSEVYQGKLDAAAGELKVVMNTAHLPAFREIARIRLARILLAQDKPKQAINLLQTEDDKEYLAPASEIKGDALLMLGKHDEAREAYIQALQLLPSFAVSRPLLQMKLDDLASPAVAVNKEVKG